jgi:hypothetical protein
MSRRGVPGVAPARASIRGARVRHQLGLADDWTVVETAGPGPFITSATLRGPDGSEVLWTSRDHRKHEQVLDTRRGSTWWAPGAIGWWIGVLFAVGSVLFALGALPGYSSAVGLTIDGTTFFVGSLFFTSAGLLQYLEVANTRRTLPGIPGAQRWHLVTWEPHRIDWCATSVQLVGTVFFNVSTFAALHASTVHAMNRRVWTPDALGSVCFLIASWLAWCEVSGGRWSWPPRGRGWWIAGVNLAGSVAFGVSALASHVVPATDQVRNQALMNLGTFIGAVFFLIGALLLLPERTSTDPPKARAAIRSN